MVRWLLCIVLVGIGCFPALVAVAAEPSTSKQPEKPSAAELVQGVIDAESKIQELKSLYLRYEGKWTRTPESIAKARAELEKQLPNRAIDEKRYSILWPELKEELELAFDQKRVRYFSHQLGVHRDLRVFDGVRAIAHDKYFTHEQEQYVLRTDPREFFEHYFISLTWLKASRPTTWFIKDKFGADRARINGFPKDFEHIGVEAVRGRPCYVLENRAALRQVLVGIDDHRLHRLDFYSVPNDVDRTAPETAAAGRNFASRQEFNSWFSSLPLGERIAFDTRLRIALFPLARRYSIQFADDYREIAPGLWLPAIQGSLDPADGESETPRCNRELHLVEVRVNEDLENDLFQIEMQDGIQVADVTHDPPLFYESKADRTPAEFQAIIDEHQQRSKTWQQQNAVRDALIGKPAPSLPNSAWLNGSTLDWAALKGKVVLLDFWATTCGPSRNDLPKVEDLHKNRAAEGIVAIGVHTAGSEADEVASFAKEMKLTYPIAIDQQGEGRSSFGRFFNEVGIHAIPYSIVVDRDGNIAAHGSLQEVLPKARELAAEGAEGK